jgi:hypothetical protein
MNSRVLFVLLALPVTPLVNAAEVADREAIAAEVLATSSRMLAAGNALDVAAFLTFLTDDSTIVQNGRVFPNLAAVRADIEAGYRGVQQIDRAFENPQVTVLSPDAALLVS